MKSNFAFLNQDELTQEYFKTASQAELSYAMGIYPAVLTMVRNVAENLARDIADQQFIRLGDRDSFNDVLSRLKYKGETDSYALDLFYQIKAPGNRAAHQLATATSVTAKDALDSLKHFYTLMVWFVNTYYDENADMTAFEEPTQADFLYQTTIQPPKSERNIIYVESADTSGGHFSEYIGNQKIGKATAGDLAMDNTDNSSYLREVAKKRIGQYMTTAGVPLKINWVELAYRKSDGYWFSDTDVHKVLERSGVKHSKVLAGNEWYHTDLETAKRAIKAVKHGQTAIDLSSDLEKPVKIVLRPEQQAAVDKTKKAFKHNDKMLWNAKMRFGKTLSALQLVKDEKYQHVLIMTHRPVVDEGWFDDFKKIQMPEVGYEYGSKTVGHYFADLQKLNKPFVYFASLQDLRGSEAVGGSAGEKNEDIFNTRWDLVIVDEAHEGTQTELAQNVTKEVVTKGHTKLLELSGTPFNLLDQYDDDQVFTWDYVMEQKAKYNWSKEHPNERNPYAGLPKVNMFTFEMNKEFADFRFMGDGKRSFNFKEFFRVNSDGEFVYKDKVRQFLRNISSPDSRTNYPFSTKEFRKSLKHTLWILPGVKEACALEKMLNNDPVFGMDYHIVNVVGDKDGDNGGVANQTDVDKVNKAIGKDPAATKTITLTVRKLTTGVTIKPWTGVMFLSNTNSSMQYLQAAFRAQTPYSSPTFGTKTNCYIFDFAPDRALTVMAASTQLNTGVGKRTSTAQKAQMSELMNFLPIIGEEGQGMKPYKVDTMLAQIKRVYAEKAVRTGFDDDSLYSDELLMLKDVDLQAFNHLKAIVGTTKSEKKPMKVDINHQGLTDEEYDDALKGQKRKPKERTLEQQAAMDKMKKLKKQRKTMISILRSISIRIPMMIYGMDVKLSDDVNIKTFVNKVDSQSWKEFMPKGVTKELFMEFSKYYDQDVFIEAGRIIRRKVKELDDLDPVERTEQLAAIFGTFRNPDKETVLTPWRVVNMHLGKTIGGLSFYDDHYQYTTQEGVSANHWVKTSYTDQVFYPNTHILEINSKTGLYPLYAGMSLCWQEFQKLNNSGAGKFSFEDQLMIWQKILRENLFLVAKTPMAKAIAQRTLAGYRDFDVNVEFVDNIVADAKNDVTAEAEKIKRLFGNMKFDVVIGNPPYQQEGKGDNARAEPIYHDFMELSYKLADLVTLITPGRFLFNAGQTPKSWNRKMLSDTHLKIIKYEQNSDHIFPRTDIKGGIVITLRDQNKDFGNIGTFTPIPMLNSILKQVWNYPNTSSFKVLVSSRGTFRFSNNFYQDYPDASNKLGKGSGNMIVSNSFERLPNVFKTDGSIDSGDVKLLGRLNNQRIYRYIQRKYILNNEYIDKYKVFVPEANGTGAIGEILSTPLIGAPLIGATDTFISIGPFDDEYEAKSTLKYVKTKFARTLLGVKKVTQHNPRSTWEKVPMQDFTSHSDIDWSKSIPEIDQQLYKKYGLSDEEINFIETKVQTME
ncbi:Eco57I restriction-modification methylase domain-containing protein [Limosilactobacillus fermentum]|uniref:Eco57I restriction-modification methylase domain-containing protein n=1 Tax=Limosilactobacillus fermentum TaxID=1613 RepID=UPI00352AA20B